MKERAGHSYTAQCSIFSLQLGRLLTTWGVVVALLCRLGRGWFVGYLPRIGSRDVMVGEQAHDAHHSVINGALSLLRRQMAPDIPIFNDTAKIKQQLNVARALKVGSW
jgi:hypothetical protein